MKLLHCRVCRDIIGLVSFHERTCQCGRSRGRYLDQVKAEYSGPAVIIMLSTRDLFAAQVGQHYPWTVLPRDHSNVTKLDGEIGIDHGAVS